jgi:hypothetical protein
MGDRAADQRIVLDRTRQGRRDQLEARDAELARQGDQTPVGRRWRPQAKVELIQRLRVPGARPEEPLFGLLRLGGGQGQGARQQAERHGAKARDRVGRLRVRSHRPPS